MARVDVERAARASSAREASDAGRRALAMGKHALARAFYDDALAMMTEDATDEARDEREGRRRRAEVMANQSACALAVEAWDDAMERAERAIACDEGYAKAHARRAAALRGKREYARARESLKVCRALLAREGETKMIRDVDVMVAEIDADEARGEQAARVGMQVKMGSKAQAKPNFSAATTKAKKVVTFDPKLDIDCDEDVFDSRASQPPSRRSSSKPMLMDLGVLAVEKAIEMQRAVVEARVEGGFEHKRCKMCGNVCHAKLTACSSCCLPLVSVDSYEPATLPRAGAEAIYESDSDDGEENATTTSAEKDAEPSYLDSDPWWVRYYTRSALSEPTHSRGLDPALRSSYAALDVAPGSDEVTVRAAFRNALARAHPDAGGSAKELDVVARAYDAISLDFWRHDEGAARLRLQSRRLADGSIEFFDSANEDIFVVLEVYRNREAEHTLKRLFSEASDPSRVYVGVTWQYKSTTPPPDALGARIDRLHTNVYVLTEEIQKRAADVKDPVEQEKYLTKMRRLQLKAQRTEDAEEKRCHSARVLEARFRDHVRETHMPWDASEGPSYARHLAMRKWGGEKYVLHIDAMTVVDKGWDEILVSELERCGDDKRVLTAAPLGYELKTQPVVEEETFRQMYQTDVYGTIKDRLPAVSALGEIDPARAPAITCAREFGESLFRTHARQLAEVPSEPTPALFFNSSFAFARAEAFVRDAPPDAHAPFLHLGEDLSASARLYTRGWNLCTPARVPVLRCYSNAPRAMWMEDHRSGKMLYADARFGVGNESDAARREFLNLLSRRRVLQLVAAADDGSQTSRDDPVRFTRAYGAGRDRSIESFIEHIGVDFTAKQISTRAARGGHDGAFVASSKSLPAPFASARTGPSERAARRYV